jgi:RND family efflux transporter MFP subunit
VGRTGKLALIACLVAATASAAWFVFAPRQVAVTRPTRGPAIDAVYATGTVEPTVMLPIAPRSSGRIAELRADEGSQVKAGEVLARLDDEDLAQGIRELAARADYARAQFERTRRLVAQNFLSAAELDRSRSERDAAEAALRRARVQRDYLALSAPAAGLIIRRDGEIGQYVAAGQTVFTLSCCAPLRVAAEVDEEDIARIRVGQKVVMSSDARPGQVFSGRIHDITPKGDPLSRSYRVRVSVDAPAGLMVGMTVDTNVILGERDKALLIPSAALHGSSVWILRDGRLARRAVETGAAGDARVEVRKGLAGDEVIVLGDEAALREGARARALP